MMISLENAVLILKYSVLIFMVLKSAILIDQFKESKIEHSQVRINLLDRCIKKEKLNIMGP